MYTRTIETCGSRAEFYSLTMAAWLYVITSAGKGHWEEVGHSLAAVCLPIALVLCALVPNLRHKREPFAFEISNLISTTQSNTRLTESCDRLVGQVVKASGSRATGLGSGPCVDRSFSGSSHTSDLRLALQRLPYQAPGAQHLGLGVVGPVSVCIA